MAWGQAQQRHDGRVERSGLSDDPPVGYHRRSKSSLPPFHSGLMAGHEQLRARSNSISQALQFRLTAAGSGDVVVDLTMRSANVHGWLAC